MIDLLLDLVLQDKKIFDVFFLVRQGISCNSNSEENLELVRKTAFGNQGLGRVSAQISEKPLTNEKLL